MRSKLVDFPGLIPPSEATHQQSELPSQQPAPVTEKTQEIVASTQIPFPPCEGELDYCAMLNGLFCMPTASF